MSNTKGLAPESFFVNVKRVSNGWLVSDGSDWQRGNMPTGEHVARTPKELCDLLVEWASKQADGIGAKDSR